MSTAEDNDGRTVEMLFQANWEAQKNICGILGNL